MLENIARNIFDTCPKKDLGITQHHVEEILKEMPEDLLPLFYIEKYNTWLLNVTIERIVLRVLREKMSAMN